MLPPEMRDLSRYLHKEISPHEAQAIMDNVTLMRHLWGSEEGNVQLMATAVGAGLTYHTEDPLAADSETFRDAIAVLLQTQDSTDFVIANFAHKCFSEGTHQQDKP